MIGSNFILRQLSISFKTFIIGAFYYGLSFASNSNTDSTSKEMIEGNMDRPTFSSDNSVQTAAENYANQAVSYALDTFDTRLDWSDDSIKDVEIILNHMHKQALLDKPSLKDIFLFAKAFSSYIGEVYRRNHGAEWGLFIWDDQIFPGLRPKQKAHDFWPWSKVQKRIENGDEENIWHYYQLIIKAHAHKNSANSLHIK